MRPGMFMFIAICMFGIGWRLGRRSQTLVEREAARLADQIRRELEEENAVAMQQLDREAQTPKESSETDSPAALSAEAQETPEATENPTQTPRPTRVLYTGNIPPLGFDGKPLVEAMVPTPTPTPTASPSQPRTVEPTRTSTFSGIADDQLLIEIPDPRRLLWPEKTWPEDYCE